MNPLGGAKLQAVQKPEMPKGPLTGAKPEPPRKAIKPSAEEKAFDVALEKADPGNVRVDRAKNLGTVLKFLEQSGSPEMREKLRALISKSLH